MRITILGGEGYLGWPTALYFSKRGHEVQIIDSGVKRSWEGMAQAWPLVPIPFLAYRVDQWEKVTGIKIPFHSICLVEHGKVLYSILKEFQPEAIIHYAEQPSAPFSMAKRSWATLTQKNNVIGTLNLMFATMHGCPEAHIIKLGTMGSYGTPDIPIEEGWLDVKHRGRTDRVLYPKRPGSFYHLSKVHDSHNLEFGCRIWDLKVTDLNQGIVYGIRTPETEGESLHTSFHYDATFGTVLNRFMVYAVCGRPLPVYGAGRQTRGFLNINDTLRCVEIAALNPPREGEFRVFNQFTEQFSILDLAQKVADITGAEIGTVKNPRVEAEIHYYNASNDSLHNLGLNPTFLDSSTIQSMVDYVTEHKHAIREECLDPTIKWRL